MTDRASGPTITRMRNCTMLIAGLAVLLGACAEPLAPILDDARELSDVPASFEDYWRQIETCSGHSRPDGVTFWIAADSFRFEVDGVAATAAYQADARRITLTPWAFTQPAIVRHEMLHAVLPARMAASHPPEYFGAPGSSTDLGRCGSIVTH